MEKKLSKDDTILIIQPDKSLQEILKNLFERNNYKVLVARDGIEGLSFLDGESGISVILTALNMERLDGIGFLESIKEDKHSPKIPIVVYDNFNTREEKERVLALGAKDYIDKSNTAPEEIVKRVSRAMIGGEYLLQIDPFALDAQLLVDKYHLGNNFECKNCGTPLAVKLDIQTSRRTLGGIVCPKCQKVYL